MVRDLNEAWGWLERLVSRVSRLESGAMLENSSITGGRMRFIGGTLRVDSGGRVELEGTLEGGGTFIWTGTFTNSGPLTQNGVWHLNGDGDIAGDVDLVGKLTTGNVRIQDGKIYVGVGGNLIVIDGATGTIRAGSMTIDPAADGGAVGFSNGSKLSANASSIGLTLGTSTVRIGEGTAGLLAESNSITVSGSGVQINLAAIPTESTSGLPEGTLSISGGGFLRRAV